MRGRSTPAARPRVGIVVQRYGEDVVGGAEAHARMLALRLADAVDVTVFTSCAQDAQTWRNQYAPGATQDGAVALQRFPVLVPRLPRGQWATKGLVRLLGDRRGLGDAFMRVQGPWSPALIAALVDADVDRFIFFTYMSYPTVVGAARVAARGIPYDFVPTAHDEFQLRFAAIATVFRGAARVAFNTEVERRLVREVVGPLHGEQAIVGCGTDVPATWPSAPDEPKCRITRPFALYLGRDKPGVELLGEAVRAGCTLPIVTAGSVSVPGCRNLGPVSPSDKWFLLRRASVVLQPSARESLGLTLLEAWQAGVPVVVNAACEVLRVQVEQSGGGRAFVGGSGLCAAVAELAEAGGVRAECIRRGAAFAERYSWDAIVRFFLEPFRGPKA